MNQENLSGEKQTIGNRSSGNGMKIPSEIELNPGITHFLLTQPFPSMVWGVIAQLKLDHETP